MKTYLLSPKIKWSLFKRIQATIPHGGIIPLELDKILWELNRDRKIFLWLEKDEMIISLKPPTSKTIHIIK